MLHFKETSHDDLKNLQALWACGDVMNYVGFPEGLHQSDTDMEKWLDWIHSARPLTNHYSVYEDEAYCGETFYQIDEETKSATMDIKLLPSARGRGIAARALTYAIEQAFEHGAVKAWVDPNPLNEKALALYRRIGMVQKPLPAELYNAEYPGTLYFEIERE